MQSTHTQKKNFLPTRVSKGEQTLNIYSVWRHFHPKQLIHSINNCVTWKSSSVWYPALLHLV